MKKLLSALAALTLCAAVFTACGGDASSEETQTSASTTISVSDSAETVTESDSETETETTVEESSVEATETTTSYETTAETTAETTSETTAATSAETTAATTIDAEEVTETAVSDDEIIADDNDVEEEVSTNFANMDEFLAADIFSLKGKNVNYDKSLSKEPWDSVADGDECYLETVSDSISFTYARQGEAVMTETDTDSEDVPVITQLILGNKFYTLDHNMKSALHMPLDSQMKKDFTPEGLGLIPEKRSKLSYIDAEIKIGGKSYTFEYTEDGSMGMLFNADGSLYGCVKSGGGSLEYNIIKWKLSSNVPSGTMNIPDGYVEIDLEELMAYAPAPEEE